LAKLLPTTADAHPRARACPPPFHTHRFAHQRTRCVDEFLDAWITKHTGAENLETKKAQLLRPGWADHNILSFNDKSFGAGGDKPFIGIYYVGGEYRSAAFADDLQRFGYPTHLVDQVSLHADALDHLSLEFVENMAWNGTHFECVRTAFYGTV